MGVLEKLMFWRQDEPEFEVDGCFTLPDANLDDMAAASATVGEPADGLVGDEVAEEVVEEADACAPPSAPSDEEVG